MIRSSLSDGINRLTFSVDLSSWDTGLLGFLTSLIKLCAERGINAEQAGLPKGVRHLLAMATTVPEQKIAGRERGKKSLLFRTGSATVEFFHGAPEMLQFLGEIIFSFVRLVSGRAQFRLSDLWWEIEEVGPRAFTTKAISSSMRRSSI